jgi:hypothetical protein
VPDSDPIERRVIEWLTTEAKGRAWQIEAARKGPAAKAVVPGATGSVFLLNYYAMRYGYDLVLAS